MSVNIMEPPYIGDGKEWLRRSLGRVIASTEAAVKYHLLHHAATEPVAGYHSLFGCSHAAVYARIAAMEEHLVYPTPNDGLILLSATDEWTVEVNERIQMLRVQITLMKSAGIL